MFFINYFKDDGEKGQDNGSETKVKNKPPVATLFASKNEIYQGEIIEFNASGSFDLDGVINLYSWDFGDGNFDNKISTNHKFLNAGTYNVTLTVRDNNNSYSNDSIKIKVIMVVNILPKAIYYISEQNVFQGDNILFDASSSYDLDGYIESYIWEIGTETFRQIYFNYVFDTIGEYSITLTVRDNNKTTDSDKFTIFVQKAISLEPKSQEHKVGFFGPNYYYIDLTITNQGGKSLILSWDQVYFWITDRNGTKYEGNIDSTDDQETIPANGILQIGVEFNYFPRDQEPKKLIFEYDVNYKETIDL
jgi:PKD repeat protein